MQNDKAQVPGQGVCAFGRENGDIRVAGMGTRASRKIRRLDGQDRRAKRLIQGGGVRIDERVEKDWRARVELSGGEVLRVGRRKYARLV